MLLVTLYYCVCHIRVFILDLCLLVDWDWIWCRCGGQLTYVWPLLCVNYHLSYCVHITCLIHLNDNTDNALSSARRPWSTSSVLCFHVFLSSADSCSLLVPRLSRPTDWSKVFVDCIHVVFCRPLGLVAGFNAICFACLAGIPSGSLEMWPANLSLLWFILSVHKCCLIIAYISLFVTMILYNVICILLVNYIVSYDIVVQFYAVIVVMKMFKGR